MGRAQEHMEMRRVTTEIFFADVRLTRMDPRAIECRIIQYTETYGIYLVVSHSGKRFLTKDPRPVETEKENSESEDETENWENPSNEKSV